MEELSSATCVVIASYNRRDVLGETLESILKQNLVPNRIYVSVVDTDHVPEAWRDHPRVQIVESPKGNCHQLNTAFQQAKSEHEFLAQFDDDVELHPAYLENAVKGLNEHPNALAMTGCPIVDGNISRAEAVKRLAEVSDESMQSGKMYLGDGQSFHLYGCNIVFTRKALNLESHDTNLPDSGYMNDIDLSIRLCRHGKIACHTGSLLVHLQSHSARPSGHKYGYSQIAVPYYLKKKKVMNSRYFYKMTATLISANLYHFLRRDRDVDRFGRLCGNLRGCLDFLTGRLCLENLERKYSHQ